MSVTPETRLDYWFSSKASVSGISVIADKYDSDHRPVMATFTLSGSGTSTSPSSSSVSETTVMSDGFGSIDGAKWPHGVFTGTEDTTIARTPTSSGLQIGAFFPGNPQFPALDGGLNLKFTVLDLADELLGERCVYSLAQQNALP